MIETIQIIIIVVGVAGASLFVAWFERWTTKLRRQWLEGEKE